MLKSRLLAGAALAVLSLPLATLSPGLPFSPTPAHAQSVNVSFHLFFDQLQSHGVWVRHARYQYVFCPTGVDADWRPYTEGRWLFVEGRGWYFASDEPFAWATYHYGRWFPDRDLGWCWVPGTKWAPAWVSWRRGNDVVGWAPLPPEEDGYALNVAVRERDLPAGYWVFVPTERFIEPNLAVSIVIGSEQPDYYTQTEYLGPVVVEGDIVTNNVIEVSYIEQTINQQVIVYQPQQAATPSEQTVAIEEQTIAVFDQDVAAPEAEAAPAEAVEEAQAQQAIEAAGGTAGATAEIAAEGEADVEAQPSAPVEQAAAPAEGETEAAPAAPDAAAPEAEPAGPDAEAEQGTPAPTNAEQPAAAEKQPAAEEPPAAEAPEQPAAPEAIPAEQPAPAEEAAPAEETVPTGAPPAEETAPADTPPAQEGAAAPVAPPADDLPCPPEARVDGACPAAQ